MALRLSEPHEPSDGANGRVPAADPLARTSAMASRAATALRAGELSVLAALFSDAAKLDTPNDRYRARRVLAEQALGSAGAVPPRSLAGLFLLLARSLSDALGEEPREPVLLNYAGVALYELGSYRAARSLFEAARRLDAELPHIERNLAEIERRERRRGGPSLPRAISAQLRAVAGDAESAAARAIPAEGLTLALCMIVKDEEEMLPRCLAAARDAVDELIVVDTGSADRTIEIARDFGAAVLEREWTGSFSDARNVSFDAATADWVMYLDADEVLNADDAPLLRELTGRTWREAFYLVETNHTGEMGDGMAVSHNALRVFRNRPEYRFEGRIHEQIAGRLPAGLPERLEPTGVRVEHFGYLGAVRDAKEKSRRNIELLERQRTEGDATPFLEFNLGSEHAAAGDAAAALRHFERSWGLLSADPRWTEYGYAPSLCGRLVRALRVNGRPADAHERAAEGLELFPGFTDLVYEQANAARDRGDAVAAESLYRRSMEMGDAPSRYSPTVGCGTYLAAIALAELLIARGRAAEARDLLEDTLARHPGYLGTVHPLAFAMLASGAEPEAVRERIESGVPEVTPSVSFMLGTALYEAGHPEPAAECFEAVVERQPEADTARIALAEALLSQRRYEEAAETAAGVAAGSPLAGAALRSELFALLAGGADSADALARARDCVPEAEHALFAAWSTVAAGGAPERVPATAAPLLATMLEALLRVEDFDSYERLLPLVDNVGLGWRERRELLASMYLRRGFLESAADEWIEVCREADPDADALVGLAQVALARGMTEDAVALAEGAEELEPGRPDAGAVLALAASN